MSRADLPMFWWRVEVDDAGEIVSCEQVEAAREGSSRVSYVWGSSPAEARRKARDWHERHKQYQLTSAKRLAKKRKAAGQCQKCTDPICPESSYLCKAHLERHREAKRRHYRGEAKPRVPGDALKLHKAQIDDHRLRLRLGEQLPELLRMYDELDGEQTAFRAWLVQEIAAREVGPALRLVRLG